LIAAPFADRLAAAVEQRRSQLCLGLDPQAEGAEEVAAECERLIELAGPASVAAKLQLACFERLGAPGWEALERVAAAAREAGLLVVADGKRGDVPHTAVAYATALVGEDGLGADAVTVNPLLGVDSLEPWVERAAGAGAGVFILVRTSNPGAADLLDLATEDGPLHERLAGIVAAERRLDGGSGLSGMGAVIGATAPARLARLRELMPRSIFLLPGVGAQGASASELGPALGEHPASILVPVSRGISAAPDPAAAAAALRDELWSLARD
jgi:orotidine-5'-phosphate decarboxylase